jgi:hypothetical protein
VFRPDIFTGASSVVRSTVTLSICVCAECPLWSAVMSVYLLFHSFMVGVLLLISLRGI